MERFTKMNIRDEKENIWKEVVDKTVYKLWIHRIAAELNRLNVGPNGHRLWKGWQNFRFHKTREILDELDDWHTQWMLYAKETFIYEYLYLEFQRSMQILWLQCLRFETFVFVFSFSSHIDSHVSPERVGYVGVYFRETPAYSYIHTHCLQCTVT
jgi:hypothetical protein